MRKYINKQTGFSANWFECKHESTKNLPTTNDCSTIALKHCHSYSGNQNRNKSKFWYTDQERNEKQPDIIIIIIWDHQITYIFGWILGFWLVLLLPLLVSALPIWSFSIYFWKSLANDHDHFWDWESFWTGISIAKMKNQDKFSL